MIGEGAITRSGQASSLLFYWPTRSLHHVVPSPNINPHLRHLSCGLAALAVYKQPTLDHKRLRDLFVFQCNECNRFTTRRAWHCYSALQRLKVRLQFECGKLPERFRKRPVRRPLFQLRPATSRGSLQRSPSFYVA